MGSQLAVVMTGSFEWDLYVVMRLYELKLSELQKVAGNDGFDFERPYDWKS